MKGIILSALLILIAFPFYLNGKRVKKQTSLANQRLCDGPGEACALYYNCLDDDTIIKEKGISMLNPGKRANCLRNLDVCCTSTSATKQPEHPHFENPGCGQRNIHGVDVRLSNLDTKETQYGEFPWTVALLRNEKIGKKEINLYVCGGSLIHEGYVLTAAHCVADQPPHKLKVRAGDWDTQHDSEKYPHQESYVREVYIHHDYDNMTLINNFAVLVLESKFVLGPSLNTICLPKETDLFKNNTNCFATGWGKDRFGDGGNFQQILKKVELPIVPHQECENALKTTRLTWYFKLHQSFMCAGGKPGKDTCTGDGGAPLVCILHPKRGPSTYYQVGIVSWGIGCGEAGIPGVYADVRKGIQWVESVLSLHN